jgi:hypothetical protein
MAYTSTPESALFHWAVTDGWELYNVKEDPGCRNNLSDTMPHVQKRLADAYDTWWDAVYPKMIERGGDARLLSKKGH